MSRIEDYALLSDQRTAALINYKGSVDWFCVPRFDSEAVFANLLGDKYNGHWRISPKGRISSHSRRYVGNSMVLETIMTTGSGSVRLTDALLLEQPYPTLVRVVEGLHGTVDMECELIARFGYGAIIPWVSTGEQGTRFVAGPDALILRTPVAIHGKGMTTVAQFSIQENERVTFALQYYPSHESPPPPVAVLKALAHTTKWWQDWSDTCTYQGPYKAKVIRSLLTLKSLSYAPTGGLLAAPTTSLPEVIGGARNWDYRYGWLRDATFSLYAFLATGYTEEAHAWKEWLVRAVAGDPGQMQIMYGIGGERTLTERELAWLSGFERSRPVRVGNAAAGQFQLDVYGEVMDALHQSRVAGISTNPHTWDIQRVILKDLEEVWQRPDEGIWEVRGPRQHFTHSKVMAWVAFDRAAKAVRLFGRKGNAKLWQDTADRIRAEVLTNAWNPTRQAFTQFYGSDSLDASVLTMPLVGFIDPMDKRMLSTVKAIQKDLTQDGFVRRYTTMVRDESIDGLSGKEGAFLLCSFWLVDNLALQGRQQEAVELYEHLLTTSNDLGLFSEEWDPTNSRMLGNFPQAFSHVGVINTALILDKNTPTSPFGDDSTNP